MTLVTVSKKKLLMKLKESYCNICIEKVMYMLTDELKKKIDELVDQLRNTTMDQVETYEYIEEQLVDSPLFGEELWDDKDEILEYIMSRV